MKSGLNSQVSARSPEDSARGAATRSACRVLVSGISGILTVRDPRRSLALRCAARGQAVAPNMPLDWLDTPTGRDGASETRAQRTRARTIEALRAQILEEGSPNVRTRLQLADLLIAAGRGTEAVPVLLGLADEFTLDGFVAKAIAILKRVEKIEPERADVAEKLKALVEEQVRLVPTAAVPAAPPLELGIQGLQDRDGAARRSEPPQVGLPEAEARGAAPAEAGGAAPLPSGAEGSVGGKIRGAFRRFLASLPGSSSPASPAADGMEGEPLPAVETDRAEEPDQEQDQAPTFDAAELAPADLPVEPATDPPDVVSELAVELQEGEEDLGPEYQDQVLDLVEDVLHQPLPGEAAAVASPPSAEELGRRLLASPLFASLEKDELLAVVEGLDQRTFEPGDVLVTEGEPGRSLFILVAGKARVFVRSPTGHEMAVARLEEGQFFGEMAALSGRPRSATVTAAGPCEVLELAGPTLDAIARKHPRVREQLEAAYVQRAESAEAAAVRSAAVADLATRQKAAEVLEAHFGESQWDPRVRLRLSEALLRAGKDEEAAPILIGLADELAREGFPEKAVAILKKVERIRKRYVEEVSLAPLRRHQAPIPAPGKAASRDPVEADKPADEVFRHWLVEVVRDTLRRPQAQAAAPGMAPTFREQAALLAYGPGLRASPLFEGFSEDELLAVIRGMRLLSFRPGDVILSEGEPGRSILIIASGSVKVMVRDRTGRNVPLCALGEGAFFGEIATLSGQPRSATVTASAPCELLELDRPTLDAIIEEHPGVLTVLESAYVERARNPVAAQARAQGDGTPSLA